MNDFTSIVRKAAAKAQLTPSPKLLKETWPVLVGDELASKTEPLALHEGVLEVAIPESWKGQSKKIAKRIKQDVSAFFPTVRGVDCVADTTPKGGFSSEVDVSSNPQAEPGVDESLEATLQRIEALMLKRELQNK